MKQIFIILFLGFLGGRSIASPTDTLRIIVLSPYKIDVAKNCQNTWKAKDKDIVLQRTETIAQKQQEKIANQQEFDSQPAYIKQMFDNDIAFLHNLTINNIISYLYKDFVNYRLSKPYKIKPKIVLLSTQRLPSNPASYKQLVGNRSNIFIINFPSMEIFKDGGVIKAKTMTEVYNGDKQNIMYQKEVTGNTKALEGYDIVRCNDGDIDCALLNSIYETLPNCVRLIAETQH